MSKSLCLFLFTWILGSRVCAFKVVAEHLIYSCIYHTPCKGLDARKVGQKGKIKRVSALAVLRDVLVG